MPGAEPYASGMAILQAETARAMPDTCRVLRPATLPQTPELDANDDPVVPPPAVVYEGLCLIGDAGLIGASQGTVNDQSGMPDMVVAQLPIAAAGLRPGDELEILTAAYSPGLVGTQFDVFNEDPRSFARYRRYLLRGSSWRSPESGGSTAPTS